MYYDGTGLCIIKSNTDYDMEDTRRETTISQQRFMRIYKQFFMDSIIGRHTLTEAQAMTELNGMIAYLQEQVDQN